MRRLVMLLGLAMLLVVVAAGAAVAVTKTCNSVPCYGTNNEDVIHERDGSNRDHIIAQKDHDVIDMNNFFNDRDIGKGNGGRDKLLANDLDGRDTVRGGKGYDRCFVDPGDRRVNCEQVRVRTNAAQAGIDSL